MLLREKHGVLFFQFPGISGIDGLAHAIFLRDGGRSKGAFQSLNVSHGIGDELTRVDANRELMKRVLESDHLMFARQQHGDQVFAAEARDFMRAAGQGYDVPMADALITNVLGGFILIQVADCQAVLIADPVKRVVANIHSGWRGSLRNIIGNTVSEMHRRYGCNPGDLMAGVGPSLGPCCGEFVNYSVEIPSEYWRYRVDETRFDFWRISRDQLIGAGVPSEQVAVSGICTRCNPHLFYSYRREKITGRFGACIGFHK